MIYWLGLLQPKNEFRANLAKSLPASAARGQNIFRAVTKSILSSCNFIPLQIAIANRNAHKIIWLSATACIEHRPFVQSSNQVFSKWDPTAPRV